MRMSENRELKTRIIIAIILLVISAVLVTAGVMRGEVFDQIVKRDEDGTLQRIDVQAKLSDRNKAAEALAKHYALLIDKVEMTKPKAELANEIEAVLHGR